MVEPGPRRRLTRTAIALVAVSLIGVIALGVSAWVLVPRWCPAFVLERSPWIEPAVRAAAAQMERGSEWDASVAYELECRLPEWGNSAIPGLEAAYAVGGRWERRLCMSCVEYLGAVSG